VEAAFCESAAKEDEVLVVVAGRLAVEAVVLGRIEAAQDGIALAGIGERVGKHRAVETNRRRAFRL
jgi:hypothetical protein